jgi:hypothetical protein
MSATMDGDKPKRVRVPRATNQMSVDRDLGRLDGAVKALEDRANRSEAETRAELSNLRSEIKTLTANTTAEFKALNDGQQQILLAMNAQTARKGVWTFLLGRIEFVIGVSTGLLGVWISKVWH